MKFLITGKNSQLAREFIKYLSKNSIEYSAFSHKELDVSDTDNLKSRISRNKPDVVINCSAYNNVDMAEKEKELCFNTNAYGVKNIAEICGKYGIKLVHFIICLTDKSNRVHTQKMTNPILYANTQSQS